ncbi:MAG TPA: M24 family metallopeptidase [Polyangiaceae bacterium]|jgi:Xaa-Pro aminopeptidase|nr:M24 family metallopeptidase [Polyangiaceae bacterium]
MSASLSTAGELRSAYVKGIAEAQRVARDAILSVVESVKPGDSERQVVARIEREFRRAKVSHWLHTPYAWWGERTRFDWHGTWETNALPSDRVLQDGEAFVLDAAPLVAGFPADFAYSGLASGTAEDKSAHARLLEQLSDVKRQLVRWAGEAASGRELCARVASAIESAGLDVIHTRYPAQVLAHTLEGFPNWCSSAPRIGTGFQLPLLMTYATGLVLHHLAGAPYPFLNAGALGRPQGLYAFEPHLGHGLLGAKFESVLLVDGDETRWLDPELFGAVLG